MRLLNTSSLLLAVLMWVGVSAYWLGDLPNQGVAPFAGAGYTVRRNVRDYGARGDGVTDDTAAINAALQAGNRCGKGCASTTTTPALVYFPAGTYLISTSLLPPYFTMMIGDASNPPILKATSNFQGFGLIDANPYYTGDLNWASVNNFYKQIRNFVIDTTNIPAQTAATGVHWPTSQATSMQNVEFRMPTTPGVVHVGLFIESGSGGFLSDLTFIGGATGASMGNQQYTMRNLIFKNCDVAIIHLWDWGWTYFGLQIENARIGIDMSSLTNTSSQNVGSLTLIDSTMTNVATGIKTAFSSNSQPRTAGSVILENVQLNNVPVAVTAAQGTVLTGSTGSTTITGWGQGHRYVPNGPDRWQGAITPVSRPASMLSGSRWYTKAKPQYETLPVSSFITARSVGAKGDGSTDDTNALQNAINTAQQQGLVLWIDHGIYRVTGTITIPAGSKIVGESFPVIMSSGSFFADMNNPRPVIQVGATSGTVGRVELSDFMVSTQGAQAGATLIEWNLASTGEPSGMWDVHTRVGGFTGSNLQVAQCLKTPGSSAVNANCIAAYMGMHVTKGASGLYMENVWIWTADHDIDDPNLTQTTIYAGRGLLVESTAGNIWLIGTASEHFVLYQYQFLNTQNIMGAQFQTETPYYQPMPQATSPFPPVSAISDPDFAVSCRGIAGNCANAWGVRYIGSSNIAVYGSGQYSFFNNYSTTCSTVEAGENCQSRIVDLQGSLSNINIYNLNTIGSLSMIDRDGRSLASWSDNVNVYPQTIAMFRTN
ncbi:hypothetical protein MCOR25_004031 [Pyricularia grisea]|uniref:Rhamnogalacturonase A/B/Epimerase-like pectate lyase domain-containing protein n=1 Tax=Pyricularia grisea TaxID=148305 RepID=A0A6P8AWU1_PYRGI|nr:uncharacterized protein PgNI_08658 [Pyricularia grisea]KAI6371097.1 hypothetical protein MCOR25_004031 [Pyricularia grisea]TLD06670.1 hypothetical protein PgNI_08658 [Pyricularia grisea]